MNRLHHHLLGAGCAIVAAFVSWGLVHAFDGLTSTSERVQSFVFSDQLSPDCLHLPEVTYQVRMGPAISCGPRNSGLDWTYVGDDGSTCVYARIKYESSIDRDHGMNAILSTTIARHRVMVRRPGSHEVVEAWECMIEPYRNDVGSYKMTGGDLRYMVVWNEPEAIYEIHGPSPEAIYRLWRQGPTGQR